jgi:hypothetical protein
MIIKVNTDVHRCPLMYTQSDTDVLVMYPGPPAPPPVQAMGELGGN